MAPQFSVGPAYCETLSAVPGVLPVEPFNTVSNGVIVLFGLLGFYVVVRRVPKAADLYGCSEGNSAQGSDAEQAYVRLIYAESPLGSAYPKRLG